MTPRNNVIESDEGFSVEVLGRVGLLYTEGPKSIEIDSEVLLGSPALLIYKNSIKSWLPPHDNESIDEYKRDAIVENVRRAFRSQGIEIHVIGEEVN